jgi:DDE superfamily endonuclease
MNPQHLDLYTDYLLSTFGQATATGLSRMVAGAVSHDQITRMLSGDKQGSAELWRKVKASVRKMQSEEGVIILDDSIEEKPYTDENEMVCWHYDHSKQHMVKGINFLSALYHSQGFTLPVGYVLVEKTEVYVDKKDGKTKRRSPISKNEHARNLLQTAVDNHIPFTYVLNDVWFASAENMRFICLDVQKQFVMPLKSNRKVALSREDQQAGQFVGVAALVYQNTIPQQIYLEDVPFPLLLIRQVFTNEDGSQGVLYLCTSDTTLTFEEIVACYQKRWHIERYHQSLKQNTALAKSPTHTLTTQANHFFASLCAFVKLELLSHQTKLNHFAIKAKLYLAANQAAFYQLQQIKALFTA